MGQFFIQQYKKELLQQAKKANNRQAAFQLARAEFEKRKDLQLLAQFDVHPVTREIGLGKSDPLNTPNISKTLSGISAEKGGSPNLWTFIGFNEGSDPIARVRKRLDDITKITITRAQVNLRGSFLEYKFRTFVPTLDDFASIAPMPFETSGNSWVANIEDGIPGLNFYLYWKRWSTSRSGGGIQTKNKLRAAQYKGVKYISKIVDDFVRRNVLTRS